MKEPTYEIDAKKKSEKKLDGMKGKCRHLLKGGAVHII